MHADEGRLDATKPATNDQWKTLLEFVKTLNFATG